MSNPINIHYARVIYKHLLYVVKLRNVLYFKHEEFSVDIDMFWGPFCPLSGTTCVVDVHTLSQRIDQMRMELGQWKLPF